MDSISGVLWHQGKFLGIEWHMWKVIGWLGNLTFFSRFLVQWYATEKQKAVVVPVAFWWLSLAGSLILFSYALFHQQDSVFICAYAFTWVPYVRNLVIHNRTEASRVRCSACAKVAPPRAAYCPCCGAKLAGATPA